MLRSLIFPLLALQTLAVPAQAATISIDLVAGQIDKLGERGFGFQMGENVLTRFMFDDSPPDQDGNGGKGEFSVFAQFTFIGQTSGALLTFARELLIETDDDKLVFETGDPSLSNPFGLTGKIELDPGKDFFSNPNSLAQVISEISSNAFIDDKDGNAELEFYDSISGKGERAFRFSNEITAAYPTARLPPEPSLPSVPLPSPALLMLFGLSALGLLGSCRRAPRLPLV